MKICSLLFLLTLFAGTSHGAEITDAYGYLLGQKLNPQDIIVKRPGMGPHDVIAKEKARAVKKVQVYAAPDTSLVFSITGLNSFQTMDECATMSTAVSFFLRKKYAEVIDETTPLGDGRRESGVRYVDLHGGKALSILCVEGKEKAILAVQYIDTVMAEQAAEKWRKNEQGAANPDGEGVSL